MFDISDSPWLICALLGLILFRPDDWQELAYYSGRWTRTIRAYTSEWQEYLQFSVEKKNHIKKIDTVKIMSVKSHVASMKITPWESKMIGGRIISLPPYI